MLIGFFVGLVTTVVVDSHNIDELKENVKQLQEQTAILEDAMHKSDSKAMAEAQIEFYKKSRK